MESRRGVNAPGPKRGIAGAQYGHEKGGPGDEGHVRGKEDGRQPIEVGTGEQPKAEQRLESVHEFPDVERKGNA